MSEETKNTLETEVKAEAPVQQPAEAPKEPARAEGAPANRYGRQGRGGSRRDGRDSRRGGRGFRRNMRPEEKEFEERVVKINRVTKVVKGGRRYRFAALVVIGDKKGRVGFGTGKANEVPDAIKKATEAARHSLIHVDIVDSTVPCEVVGEYGAAKVVIRPAADGTGVSAGGPVRAVMELAGVSNVLTKCIGSRTPINMVRATFNGLTQMKTIEQVEKYRGLKPYEIRH